MRLLRTALPWLAAAGVALLALWATQTPPTSVWSPAPGWGNGRVVAALSGAPAAPRPAPLLVDDQGTVYLFILGRAAEGLFPQLVALRPDGRRAWDHAFPVRQSEPSQLALRWDGPALRLLWVDAGRLYSAGIAPDGSGATAPQAISGAAEVAAFAAASTPGGGLHIWYAGPRDNPGLYALPPGGPPQLIDPAGVQPALQLDAAGALHAAWLAAPPGGGADTALWYTALRCAPAPPSAQAQRQTENLFAMSVSASQHASAPPLLLAQPTGEGAGGEGQSSPPESDPPACSQITPPARLADLAADGAIEGPWLGVGPTHATLLWAVRVTQGRNAGSVYAQYLRMPLGEPARAEAVAALGVPDGADLAYAPAAGAGLQAGPRVPLDPAGLRGGAAPTACAANAAAAPEPAIACQAQIQHRYDDQFSQIGLILFAAGRPAAYQLISFGGSSAYAPSLASDAAGQLYLSWASVRSDGYVIYLATTAPELAQALSAPRAEDLGWLAFEVIFGMAQGMIFTPFTGLLWSIAPLALIGAVALARRGRGEPGGPWAALIIAAAIGLLWAGKWRLLFAQAWAYVPFSAWLPDIPAWLGLPLRVGVPAASAGLALWLAHRRTYGRQAPSVLLFTLIYSGVDTLLTMAVYGGIFFGAFYPQG